ncbi:MAG: Hsp70 family protein [Bacteroidetes bacterium]|nr:Hsp70 family protein [Bacteroidota bacterium]
MARYIYGIDFGTSNSALAVLDVERHEIVKVLSIPSVLFFPESGGESLVGRAAIEGYIASEMRGRFMKSVKRILPNNRFRDTKIGSKRYTAEDLVALLLTALKAEADAWVGESVTTAVIGRPVIFDEDPERDALAQARLAKAVQIAGFEKYFFQFEPIGAAFTYEGSLAGETQVLVADFGGGTSDFSLMRLNPARALLRDRSADMRAKGGIYIGGDSFDSAIMWERGTPHFGRGLNFQSQPGKWLPLPITFFHNICYWDKMNFFDSVKIRNDIDDYYHFTGKRPELQNLKTLVEKNLTYQVFQQIEATKIALSTQNSAVFQVNMEGILFKEKISLQAFSEEIIQEDLDRIDGYLGAFLEKQGVAADQVDVVFLTGGTSLVRPVRERLAARFGAEKLRSGDDFESVVKGLALSYRILGEGE